MTVRSSKSPALTPPFVRKTTSLFRQHLAGAAQWRARRFNLHRAAEAASDMTHRFPPLPWRRRYSALADFN